ncbi:UDP-N-acetylmuramoyl-L-alanine--D-glutamate ligase [Qipengyuania atrilutea]|uniref:UDP-N-acetylmuramoylalanine--D-glutamate ligase n=1 Tax=Qipengyuania atrilutea TaxID=2744473 RepID=A0A850HF17_9SPHN|nr:UDP-N-acetylmuramoyl-L-alanine--D-glutamate ligase [Actirhodobacter atriluteus]NVD45889.1 UDP-N-acetylmuramoyl-L-alanine--D-glutamate ligase [Actirhodobacter atriluteus]
MITSPAWKGKRYAVLGLARSGRATVRALLASGAEVLAWDSDAGKREAFAGQVELADPVEADLSGFAGVIVSPGVPLNTHPIKPHADSYGVPVIGDIELFAQARADLPPHKVVGITGTNGKSTTTALVHHILKTAGVPTTMGGNIGLPILEQEPLPEGGVYVLELSSYQIDLTYSLDCDVAVLLNITPDHLDRYDGDFEKYAASKARLFEMQTGEKCAVCRAQDWWHGQKVGEKAGGKYLEVFDDVFHQWQDVPSAIGIQEQSRWHALQGPHNLENAEAAIATGFLLDLSAQQIRQGLETYPGLPHRMERVAEICGVAYVNDSKGTNTAASAPALAAFDNIHWILGGLAKEPGLGECEAQLGHVKAAYTIGEAGEMFAQALEGAQVHLDGVERCLTLDKAIKSAAANAESGDTVLLSPACASFDQFRDFEERGDRFRSLVQELSERPAA